MRETKTKKIGDYTYSVNQLGALEGRKLFFRLAQKIMPAVASLKEGKGDLGSLLDPDEIENLCDRFAQTSTVTGGMYGAKEPCLKDCFDLHFAGQYADMFKWLWFCIEVNYGSFLKEMGIDNLTVGAAAKA